MKAVLEGKIYAYIKKEKRSQNNNLNLQLKKLEKYRKLYPKQAA